MMTDRQLRWSKFTLAISIVAGLCAYGASQSMVVPSAMTIQIAGSHYSVSFVDNLTGPARIKNGIILKAAASMVTCPVGAENGRIRLDAKLTPSQQAKALIHETVHIAEGCDKRALPVDEKVAQDIADLFDSGEGRFVVKELTR